MSFGWEIKVSKFWFCCLLEKLQDSSFLLSLSPPLLPKKNGCFFLNLKTILFKSNCKNLYYSDSYKENVQITRNPTVNILREIVIRMHTNTHFTHSHTMLHRLLWVYFFFMSRIPFPINKNPHHHFNSCGILPYIYIPFMNSLWLTFRLILNICSHVQQR